MPLESAVYISDLNSSYPPEADPVMQAADHMRLVKQVLKSTFPNVAGPVTATHGALSAPVPVGLIGFWKDNTSVPSGWHACDGTTQSKSDGSGTITLPDLITGNPFIRMAGGSVAPLSTGGAATHAHNLNIAGYALAIGDLPAHNHGVTDPGHNHTVNDPGHTHTMGSSNIGTFGSNGPLVNNAGQGTAWTSSVNQTGITLNAIATGITINNAGGGAAHGHTGSTSDSQSNVPPYVGIVPIMKI